MKIASLSAQDKVWDYQRVCLSVYFPPSPLPDVHVLESKRLFPQLLFIFATFLLQFDASEKFYITLPRQGYITIASNLDYEPLAAAGRTTYMLNISANVSSHFLGYTVTVQ